MKGCLKVFLALFVGVPALLVAGLWIALKLHQASLHYRLTLVVEADGKTYQGSGVWAVKCNDFIMWLIPGSGGEGCLLRGEAFPVDLGPHGMFFVTLATSLHQPLNPGFAMGPAYLPWLVFRRMLHNPHPSVWTYREELQDVAHERPSAVLPIKDVPIFVRFGDLKDPKSVEEVNPARLDRFFGPGVRLVSARIKMTDDPVTTGISKLLIWVDSVPAALDPTKIGKPHELAGSIVGSDFKKGDYQ